MLECNDKNQMNHDAASTQWLYQLWMWNAENGVTIAANKIGTGSIPAPGNGHRDNDFRLMDKARNSREKRAIARHLPRCTWASDVLRDEGGRTLLKPPGDAGTDTEWMETASTICAGRNGRLCDLGDWVHSGDPEQALREHVTRTGW